MNGEILLITEAGYPWTVGGVTSWVNDLAAGLPERPITVLGIRFEGPQAPLDWVLPPGVRFVDVCVPAPARVSEVAERVLASAGSLQPAVIHASTSGVAGAAGLALSEATGAPLAITEHGIAWRETQNEPLRFAGPPTDPGNNGNGKGWGQGGNGQGNNGNGNGDGGSHGGGSVILWDREGRRLARAVYARAARITSVSHANAVYQRRLAPRTAPIEVIHNGVELPAPTPFTAEALRTVVFVGRISPEKGVDRFIRAAALLAKADAKLRFEVRGPESDATYAARCRRLAVSCGLGERLVFTGALPRAAAFAGAGLLIAPSRDEACPYVVLEAMAAGVPVVAANAGDCEGIVGEAGIVVRGGPAHYARAALQLLDPAAHAAASAAGRERVRAWFSRERMLARYRRLYGELERGRGRLRKSA